MLRVIGSFGLFAAVSLLLATSSGCGDDDHGRSRCNAECNPDKPFCAPDGKCVECEFDTDCPAGKSCNGEFECKG